MGKHSGPADEEKTTPYGEGPHPTEEESTKLAASFDQQYGASKLAGDVKNDRG